VEDMDAKETAESLGISVGAVKNRLLRVRKKLRKKLVRSGINLVPAREKQGRNGGHRKVLETDSLDGANLKENELLKKAATAK